MRVLHFSVFPAVKGSGLLWSSTMQTVLDQACMWSFLCYNDMSTKTMSNRLYQWSCTQHTQSFWISTLRAIERKKRDGHNSMCIGSYITMIKSQLNLVTLLLVFVFNTLCGLSKGKCIMHVIYISNWCTVLVSYSVSMALYYVMQASLLHDLYLRVV